MKINNFILLSLLVFCSINSFAQVGKISGKVISEKNEGLISSLVTVSLLEFSKPTSTDYNGDFTINNLKPGIYKVTAKYVGFESTVLENIEVKANQTTTLNIVLFEKKKQLKD